MIILEVAILLVLLEILSKQHKGFRRMSKELDELVANVASLEEAVDRVGAFLRHLHADILALKDNASDPAALQQLADRVKAQADEIDADIAEGQA